MKKRRYNPTIMKNNTNIFGFDNNYAVSFISGNQSFVLTPQNLSRKQAEWYRRMLSIALTNFANAQQLKL